MRAWVVTKASPSSSDNLSLLSTLWYSLFPLFCLQQREHVESASAPQSAPATQVPHRPETLPHTPQHRHIPQALRRPICDVIAVSVSSCPRASRLLLHDKNRSSLSSWIASQIIFAIQSMLCPRPTENAITIHHP
ncbi:uncharacterized protein K489DRAFT_128034 [Dissoconium aciculare CBS 342.82]|uniref:Uncharacterized protein n=1 Tax=Dissoconium aciculare CBS 342.82 TaxID=1314786 RepID=A0A6J3LQZ0_9PEZI|nr:uncharacterized protein K489DRAFT_128034 [Dissoconium aciculare CBS 342.82]KAF1818255.1 hypothetical protein K489DRAFT_128034 [Dissoconium aciculare CBS 342.82]